jgi:hypothetical protein
MWWHTGAAETNSVPTATVPTAGAAEGPVGTTAAAASETATAGSAFGAVAETTDLAFGLLGRVIGPLLDFLWEEKEKAIPLIVHIVGALVPLIRNRSQPNSQRAYEAVGTLRTFCGYPYTFKAWRKEVWDLFLDADFFTVGPSMLRLWDKMLDIILTQHAPAFNELFGRSSGPAVGMLTSREAEINSRCKFLERMGFAILCGDVDQYVPHLAAVQEKLIDALKFANAPLVHVRVFFCLRILALKIAATNLVSVWPMVWTELVRVLQSPVEGEVVLAALKLLDLMLVLRPEPLQLYQVWRIPRIASRPLRSSPLVCHKHYSSRFAPIAD